MATFIRIFGQKIEYSTFSAVVGLLITNVYFLAVWKTRVETQLDANRAEIVRVENKCETHYTDAMKQTADLGAEHRAAEKLLYRHLGEQKETGGR